MFRSSSSFDRLLDRATSHLLLEPDWDAIMSICDAIRSAEVAPKYVVAAVKKKFYSDNKHVVLHALLVIESCVKNCGPLIHDEVCTKAFMEELRVLVKHATDENVEQKILEILQTWGMAFRSQPKYRIVTDTLNVMKAEGWKFPPVREAEAMFEADNAPEWADGDVCHRCRVQFGMMTRQHHCRGCGQVFCSRCSAKSCPIPKFGLEKEVRVCDACFDSFGPKDNSSDKSKAPDLPADQNQAFPSAPSSSTSSSSSSSAVGGAAPKSEAEIREEEDLQLALALSQSEAEEKEKQKLKSGSSNLTSAKSNQEQLTPSHSVMSQDDLNPELLRYLDRDYWESKEREKSAATAKPSLKKGPGAIVAANLKSTVEPESDDKMNSSLSATTSKDIELDEFVATLRTQVEIFVNRMKSNSSRGRPIANDSSVQTLFMNTMAMHSKLLRHIQEQEDCRVHYEGLQDKLTQVKDARAALDALREEERERRRREAEEAERLRQIQMREKLELMRQKKQEYLQYQRQIALQKMQEQEQEMLLRQEQAKQQYFFHQQQHHPHAPPGQGAVVGVAPTGTATVVAAAGASQPIYAVPAGMMVAAPSPYQTSFPYYPNGELVLPAAAAASSAIAAAPNNSSAMSGAVYSMHALGSALPPTVYSGPGVSSQQPVHPPPATLPTNAPPQQPPPAPHAVEQAELISFD